MKKLTEIVKESQVDCQENVMKNASSDDLKKYLEVADKFLCDDAKDAVKWFIDNPGWAKKLGTESAACPVAAWLEKGLPSDASLKPLYKSLRAVMKSGKQMQIPFFQTEEQFEAVLNKEASLDEICLDLTSEKGRNEIAKKYDPLVWKIARQFNHKTAFSLDDLHAFGQGGLTWAMNKYGKRTDKTQADEEAVKKMTFLSYASWMIRNEILQHIKNEGHMVRIPTSVQARERQQTGSNTKSNSISIDTAVATDKEGHSKTIADKIGDYERGGKTLDYQDIDDMWKDIKGELEKRFSTEDLDVFYSHFGLFDHKKLSGKEIMQKYGFKNQSNINAVIARIFKQIKNDPKLWEMFNDIRDLMTECRHDDDLEDRDYEPASGVMPRYLDESSSYSPADDDEF